MLFSVTGYGKVLTKYGCSDRVGQAQVGRKQLIACVALALPITHCAIYGTVCTDHCSNGLSGFQQLRSLNVSMFVPFSFPESALAGPRISPH